MPVSSEAAATDGRLARSVKKLVKQHVENLFLGPFYGRDAESACRPRCARGRSTGATTASPGPSSEIFTRELLERGRA